MVFGSLHVPVLNSQFYRCSMRAPFMAWEILYLYLGVTQVTMSLACSASSDKVVANGGTYTASLMYPQRKN